MWKKITRTVFFSHQILESIRFGNLVTDWVLESGLLGKPDQPKNGADNKAYLYVFNFFFHFQNRDFKGTQFDLSLVRIKLGV